MPISIVKGTNDKPAASQALARFFSENRPYRGQLFIGYPIIGTSEGRYAIDALLVSPEKGIVVFDLIEGHAPGDFEARQDDSANKLEARLKTHRELVNRRSLLLPISTLSFAPALNDPGRHSTDGYPLANLDTLGEYLDGWDWPDADEKTYERAISAIQSISTIRKGRIKRTVSRDDSRGGKLKRLEDSIATLDNLQSRAVIETVDGVQRIRGLAGSGKTIVLALKAAYLHAQHPDWRIAVTFNTRSLKGHFRRLINNFSVEQTGEEPDWDNLKIVNAWGAPGNDERDGIYHQYCRARNVEYLDFRSARITFGTGNEFAGACEKALADSKDANSPLYQVILVDEAQDFPPAFLRLCYSMLDDEKRLVYAYDELQNLSSASMPPPEEIFGLNADGSPVVRLEESPDGPRRDVILEKCYRNSRPVLVTAHALGFGTYRRPPKPGMTGLVQIFNDSQLWEEIGYRVIGGELVGGSEVSLRRTEESSPRFLEEHSPIDDLIQFISFDSTEAQADWLVGAIRANLEMDELRHDDIVVINPDPLTTRERVGPMRRRLLELGINSHLAGVDTDPDVFYKADSPSITFTGVYRAKGNEAGIVYIVNAQDCDSSAWNLASIRNRLFTSITRSKAWVRVLGVGEGMRSLSDEYESLRAQHFELRFKYPTQEEREQLKIVHRDMSRDERENLQSRQRSIHELVADLESGKVHREDLDDRLLVRLQELLSNRQ